LIYTNLREQSGGIWYGQNNLILIETNLNGFEPVFVINHR